MNPDEKSDTQLGSRESFVNAIVMGLDVEVLQEIVSALNLAVGQMENMDFGSAKHSVCVLVDAFTEAMEVIAAGETDDDD